MSSDRPDRRVPGRPGRPLLPPVSAAGGTRTAPALRRTAVLVVAALVAGIVAVVGPLPAALAAAGITLTKSGPASVLAGSTAAFTLTAANPASNPDAVPEYNLSFRDVLPLGLTYVAGSVTPASAGEPTIVVNGSGQQVLIWRNVSDLQVGDDIALGFSARVDQTALPVGSDFANLANAYAHTDPRRVPAFDATGSVVAGSFTESASASTGAIRVSALQVSKSEPSPESELLRGIHTRPTVYTLTVRNTGVAATNGVVVTDYLPASLEFLGCGGVDNSSAREYPGAPPLTATPSVPGCRTPVSVETVTNPPAEGTTTYPAGVYTKVTWNLGVLAAGAVVTVPYAAGIPLRANTAAFAPGPAPTPASLGQTANLDNNSGASTREGATEATATNIARASGTYTGALAPGASSATAADTRRTVAVEDVRMRKSASVSQFATLGRVQYTLTIDAGEYVSAGGTVVTDIVPNGMCPLGEVGSNYVPGSPADCAGETFYEPSTPIQSVTQNPDGSFTVVFAPLPTIDADGTATIRYWVGMRDLYLGSSEPTSSGDSFTNRASLTSTTTPVPATGATGTATVTDASTSTITTSDLALDKTIGRRSMNGVCGTDGTGYGEPSSFPAAQTQFRKGDVICFKLRVDFDAFTRTRNPVITDFLPPGTQYVAGSAVPTTNDRRSSAVLTATADSLSWRLGDPIGANRFVDLGAVFEWVFAVTVTNAAPIGSPDILGNAMKLRAEDSSGRARSYRDQVDFTVVPAAPVSIVKGIERVDVPAAGPNGLNSNVDGLSVREGSTVRFRIDVTNSGVASGPTGYPVGGLDVWDPLPAGITCAAISSISGITKSTGAPVPVAPTATCTNPGQPGHPTFTGSTTQSAIRWTQTIDTAQSLTAQTIAPGESFTYTYDMRIPSPTSVGRTFTNTAAVRSFQAAANRPGSVTTFFPRSNIDTSVPVASQDAPAASDTSRVVTPAVSVGKVGTTSITETNNNAANQATVGELVTFRYAVTIPDRTAVFNATLTDALPTGFAIVTTPTAPAPALEFCPSAPTPSGADPLPVCAAPGAVPAGVTLNAANGTVTFPATYDNTTATPQRFLVTLTVRVGPTALATTSNAVNAVNSARFNSRATLGGTALAQVQATYTVNVRQPGPAITKTNTPTGPRAGGDVVTFTVTAFNRNTATTTTNRPPLHDAFVVDCLPSGLTFLAYGPNPGLPPVAGNGTNGCPTGTTRLVWRLGTVPPSTVGTARTYTATVNPAAVGGDAYVNTARLTGSTLNDGKANVDDPDNATERTYSVSATSTVTIAGSAVTKTASPTTRTIGQASSFTMTATVPANVNFYAPALLDRIPAGQGPPTAVTFSCVDLVTSASCGTTGSLLPPAVQPDGSSIYGFTVPDLLASPNQRRITITYSSAVLDVPANVAGAGLTDSVQSAWFSAPGGTPTSNPAAYDRLGATATATVTVLEPRLTITKAVSDTTPAPGDAFTYTVRVVNATGPTVSPAYGVVVTDTVPTGVVVTSVAGGGTISGADPVTGGGTITWPASALPGPLAPGDAATLTYAARLAPSSVLTGAGLVNTARNTAYLSLPSGGRTYAGGSATATVTPDFPRLITSKAATGGAPAYIGGSYTWTVTVTNTGAVPALGVDVVDTLPPSWLYDAGSARVSIDGSPSVAAEPSTAGSPQQLTWTDLGALQPGRSLTVTYRATPQPGVVSAPGVGASVPHTNAAVSTGDDATGASGNADGPYGGVTATASTRIDSADVRIDKSHAAAPVAGTAFDWTVVVSNAGPDTAVGPFHMDDAIESPATFVSASGTGWSCAFASGGLSCTRTDASDTLASGAAFPPITVRVALPDDLADGSPLSNSATVTARTYDPQPSNNTDTDTAAVTTRADLAIHKDRSAAVVAGQDATYTLDVVNNGPSVSRGPIVVTDDLPASSALRSATGAGWSCAASGGTLTCTRAADLLVGQAAPQITVVVGIAPSQTADVVNTASVSGPTTDPRPDNNTDGNTATPTVLADLAIQKADVGSVVAGTTATYRLTVDNLGPSDAAAPVRIVDTLPAGLTYVSKTDVAGAWTCGAAAQVVTCTLTGSLAAGAEVAVEIRVAVASSVTGTITNTATVSSPTTDPNPANNTDTESTAFVGQADLAIAKTGPAAALAGEQITWSLAVTNNGPSDSPGTIRVTDALPTGTSFVSAGGSGWTCSESAGTVTCTRAATLVAGGTAPAVSVVAAIAPDAGPSTLTNTASVDGPVTDPDPTNNTDQADVVVSDSAELSLTKATTGADPVRAGESTEFTITVRNAGPSMADSAVVVDTMPAGLVPVSASGAGWACAAPVGQTIQCAQADLDPGSSTIVVQATVSAGVLDGTTLTNSATVSTTTPGDDPSNNTGTAPVDVIAEADLSIVKSHTGDALAGSEKTFDLEVRNDGPSDAQAPITVVDTLPAGLSYVTSTGPWTCSAAGQTVTCTERSGDPLAAGADAPVLQITVLVDPAAAPGAYTNTAEVSSPTTDPVAGNNTATDDLVVSQLADLAVTKVHAGPVRIGDPLAFTLTVSNAGPSIARDVRLVDTLPAGLAYVSAGGTGWTCAEASGVVTCDLGAPLAPGSSADPVALVVTVEPSAYPSVTNAAEVTTSTPETSLGDNRATDVVAVPPLVNLSVTKTHASPFTVGSSGVWTVAVANAGPTDDPGPLTIVDSLPDGVSFASIAAADAWTCSATGQLVTCTLPSGLAAGASTSIDLVVDVLPTAVPQVVNNVTVSTPSEETTLTDNTAQDTVPVEPKVVLTMTKRLDGFDEETRVAAWRITVVNEGPNDSVEPIVVTDDLPPELSYEWAAGPGWSCTYAGRTVTCVYAASLAAGSSASLVVQTIVGGTEGQIVVNNATLDLGSRGTVIDGDKVPVPDGGLGPTGTQAGMLFLLGLMLVLLGIAAVSSRRLGRR